MSRRRGWSAASWLLFWLFWCGCCVEGRSSGPGECPARAYRPPELSLRDRGGLSSLVASAESTRSVVVGGNLPYEFISTRAREAYNGSRPLTPSVFFAEWTGHTQNALFVGGFVLFVGVLFPAAAMALWTFLECCYEDDEEEERENRNLTLQSQVVVWSLAGALIVALVVLLVMVGILLGANSWITRGVTQGGAIVERTIPQLVELRDSALQSLDELLIEGYDNLTLDLQTSRLDEIPLEVSTTVSVRHSTTADTLSQSIAAFLSERPRLLYNLTVSVTTALSLLHNLTSSLNHSLVSLRDNCSLLTNEAGNSSLSLLSTLCDDFTFDPSSLVPDSRSWNEVGGVSEDGRSFLSQLESVLSREALSQTDRIPLPRDLLLEYLNEMTQDLSSQVNSTTETYFSSLGGNLSLFTEEVAIFYNSSLTLHSQPRVELYLGPRHLGNWEWFRSALTVTFAVLIFAGSLPLLVALGRGLYFVTAIYRYSDSATYDHGAHQSGMVIKKIAFSLCVICIISASFTGVCLSLAGVMGKACGNHNNFSELLENVVDNPRTWSDKEDTSFYPLAAVLLNLSHYPLRVSDTLSACRSNTSLFRAFHLEQRYDLEDRIWLSPTKKKQYRQEMQDIHLRLAAANLSSAEVAVAMATLNLTTNIPINWAEVFVSLSSSSSAHLLTQLAKLRRTVGDIMNAAVSVNGSEVAAGVYGAADEALGNLDHLVTRLEPSSLSATAETASQLNRTLVETSRLSSSLSLSLLRLSANVSLTTRTKANQLVTQASEMTNNQLELYLNSCISAINCDIGECHALAADYDSFSRAVCGEVVPGMDLYWTVLLITLTLSVFLMYLCLFVAWRLVNPEMWKSNGRNPKLYLNVAVVTQGCATLWQLASLSVYLWWIVYLSRNDFVRREYCSGCCRNCVWGFGALFLIVSALVGGASRGYQYFTVYMIKKCKAMKYKRFWIDRNKAVNFYGELTLVFLQDLPFLILVALSSSELGFLSVPAFYSLSVSLLSILTHLIFLLRQRNNIPAYWAWLKLELNKFGLMKRTYTPNQDPPPSSNGGVVGLTRRGGASVGNGHINSVRSPYESSGSDHSENSSQGTFQEHGFEFHPPRLSDIPEYPEGGLDSVGPGSRPGGGMGPGLPRIPMLEPHINDDESEMSEQNSQFQSRVRLDRDIELDSEAYLQRRRDAIDNFERGGVEVAPSHYRHRDMDASTISDSYYYGSRNSIELQGYVSSSHVPDYESSDCRDEDGDSVYSEARYQLPVPSFMGEVTVDV